VPDRVAQHPAIELGHHAVVLERRQELARRQQRALFLAHAHQDLAQREGSDLRQRGDRLAVELEFVAFERGAQARRRIPPAGELLVHPIEKPIFHQVF
jgi:hypothetical protein